MTPTRRVALTPEIMQAIDRQMVGRKQTDVARAAGLRSRQHVNSIIHGNITSVTVDTFRSLMTALDLDPDEFINDDDIPTTPPRWVLPSDFTHVPEDERREIESVLRWMLQTRRRYRDRLRAELETHR